MFGCCCPSCDFFTDDYSVDNLSTDYTTSSGSWSVGSGKLTTTSSSALLLVNTTSDSNCHVTNCSVTMAASGDSPRVVVGYVDTSNYIFLELVQGASTVVCKLYKRVAGTNTQLGVTKTISLSPGSPLSFKICCGPDATVAQFTTANKITDPFISTGSQIGFATGAVIASASFDNLTLRQHTTACGICNTDCDRCLDDVAPDDYAVLMPDDLTSDTGCGGCANVVGTFIISSFFNPFPTCSWFEGIPVAIGGCSPSINFGIGISVYRPIDPAWDGGASPGTYRIVVKLEPNGLQLVWQKDYGASKPDCLHLDNEEIPIVYAGTAGTRCKSTSNKSVFLTAVNS